MKCSSRMKYSKIFRFDENTLSLLQNNVEKYNNITASEYIRELIRRDAAEKVNGIRREDFTDIRRQLAGIGNNLNQIAHRMNMEIISQYDIDEVIKAAECIADLKDLINQMYEIWEGR